MLIAALALAMIFGGFAASAALIAGWSLFAALAIYSASGLLGVLVIGSGIALASTLKTRKGSLSQTDIAAYN